MTHVLNAAKGSKFSQVDTNESFYADVNMKFFGCALMDVDGCKIEKYFHDAARFINEALSTEKGIVALMFLFSSLLHLFGIIENNCYWNEGKVLVHCYQGISRSATIVMAYLLIYRKLKVEDALQMIMSKRIVWPNNGFLNKLIFLESQIKHDTQ